MNLYLIAPSGIVDPPALERAVERLRGMGFALKIDAALSKRWRRFAGTDAARAAAFERACADRASRVVIAARGGYGLSRIIDRIDYAACRASDKLFIGHSDFTAFNLALLARAGARSVQGPAVVADFGGDDAPDPFMWAQLQSMLAGQPGELRFDAQCLNAKSLDARGKLWGGNLAMLVSLLGTRYMPPVRGGILFLEDVGESPYRIERMLLQLAHSGIAGRQRAIVLGRFNRSAADPSDETDVSERTALFNYTLNDVFGAFAERIDVPVLSGLPFGHIKRKACLPVGVTATLGFARGKALLDWPGWKL